MGVPHKILLLGKQRNLDAIMAERLEDPVEADVLHQEKIMSNPDHDDELSILRVISRRSTRGNEVRWTEEARKRSKRVLNDSEETIAGESEDVDEDRGILRSRFYG
jgi:hypothetical protein